MVTQKSEFRQEYITGEGKNMHKVVCAVSDCKSVILRPNHAEYKTSEAVSRMFKNTDRMKMPEFEHKSSVENAGYWMVDDAFTFDNIGFSKPVQNDRLDGIRYLCCADCDSGPIGLQDVKECSRILLDASRVKYV